MERNKPKKKHAVVFFNAKWEPLYYMHRGKMIKINQETDKEVKKK